MTDDPDPNLEFLEGPTVKMFRATCMRCGSRFDTPAEIRLHSSDRCRQKFWYWFANQHPWALAIFALQVGYLIGYYLPR